MRTFNIKVILISAVLFALLDKIWFGLPLSSKIYNNTVSLIQGSEIDSKGKIPYAVLAYLIMGVVYSHFIYPKLNEDWQYSSLLFSLAIWGVFNLTNIVIFKKYTLEMLGIDILWGITVTQILGFIFLKLKK